MSSYLSNLARTFHWSIYRKRVSRFYKQKLIPKKNGYSYSNTILSPRLGLHERVTAAILLLIQRSRVTLLPYTLFEDNRNMNNAKESREVKTQKLSSKIAQC